MAVAHLLAGRYARAEGAHVVAHDGEGRILVVRLIYLGGGWMLPGGRVERNETPDAAAARETLEETGIEVRITRLLLVDARRSRSTSFVFEADPMGGSLAPQPGEVVEVGWLTRAVIAESSPRLDRLLAMIEATDTPAYVSSRGLISESPTAQNAPRDAPADRDARPVLPARLRQR